MAARAKKILAKRFAHAISVHWRDLEHACVNWIWLRGSASYAIILIMKTTTKKITPRHFFVQVGDYIIWEFNAWVSIINN